LRKHLPGVRHKRESGVSEFDTPGRAVEQWRAEFVLETADRRR
jgi:hypothetical protein